MSSTAVQKGGHNDTSKLHRDWEGGTEMTDRELTNKELIAEIRRRGAIWDATEHGVFETSKAFDTILNLSALSTLAVLAAERLVGLQSTIEALEMEGPRRRGTSIGSWALDTPILYPATPPAEGEQVP